MKGPETLACTTASLVHSAYMLIGRGRLVGLLEADGDGLLPVASTGNYGVLNEIEVSLIYRAWRRSP